jgi:CPA1 family monovalent cation:H+ antiporter
VITVAALDSAELVVLLLLIALGVALVARWLRFPYTLALVLVGLALGIFGVAPNLNLNPDLVLFLFLPALLFEGAWSIEVSALRANWMTVFLLAVPGLLISLAVVALVLSVGAGLPLLIALLLGAIVSPTDPVAVLVLLRQLGMPERLRTIVEGESLFNDGIGAAVFTLVLGLLLASLHAPGELAGLSLPLIVLKGVWLIVGGPLLGGAIGLLVGRALHGLNDRLIETAVTFGVAYGSYLLGIVLGTSGLLAVVVASLVLGSYGRRYGMSRRTRYAVDDVWEFTGYIANSFLFLLLGHLIGAASFVGALGTIGWAVVGVLAGRALIIYLPLSAQSAIARWLAARRRGGAARELNTVPRVWRPLLLLAGLRGALSLALALTLPPATPQRSLLQLTVYGVVLVTLVGQGLCLRLLLPGLSAAKVAQ